MSDHETSATYACGHQATGKRSVLSPVDDEALHAFALAFRCPDCHYQEHVRAARLTADSFGLPPLVGEHPKQCELAEIIRFGLLCSLLPFPSFHDQQAREALVPLLSRCVDAAFWIDYHAVQWEQHFPLMVLRALLSSSQKGGMSATQES